jgi:hypothetical protein
MITYSTNWMGPINSQWIKEHGQGWSAGRIDIYGVPDEPYPLEYGLSPMRTEDWNALSDYLDTLQTKELLSYDELIEGFESYYGLKITWCYDDE